MRKAEPVDTVRFAQCGAEESGLVGSDFYVNGCWLSGYCSCAKRVRYEHRLRRKRYEAVPDDLSAAIGCQAGLRATGLRARRSLSREKVQEWAYGRRGLPVRPMAGVAEPTAIHDLGTASGGELDRPGGVRCASADD
jgi:hypothetical protein